MSAWKASSQEKMLLGFGGGFVPHTPTRKRRARPQEAGDSGFLDGRRRSGYINVAHPPSLTQYALAPLLHTHSFNMPRLSKIASVLSLATAGLAAAPIPSIIPLAVTGTLDGYVLTRHHHQAFANRFLDVVRIRESTMLAAPSLSTDGPSKSRRTSSSNFQ